MTTYTLLGYMGAGKSYWGRRLAQHLAADFTDLDDYLQAQAQQSIAQLFATQGEAAFRRMEADALRQVMATVRSKPHILALGGGTPIAGDNMRHILAHSVAIYLQGSPQHLAQRLMPGRAHRPLLRSLTDDQLLPFIEQQLALRASIYQQAHHCIDLDAPNAHIWQQLLAIIQAPTPPH